jgi:hypothetical protein
MKIRNMKETRSEATNLLDLLALITAKGTTAVITTYKDHSSSKKTRVNIPNTNENRFRASLVWMNRKSEPRVIEKFTEDNIREQNECCFDDIDGQASET